ncbi:MAG: WbuC family cupin fold metalloprotein [Chloroflexota bacterium]|nr:WbuC family cupin fold metalloprotein [Chloroflexota bacterium]
MTSRSLKDEVFVTSDHIVTVSGEDVRFLKTRAAAAPRKRSRLCAHAELGDSLHEMVVVLSQDTYVRPHKHLGKSESFHIVEGALKVVILDDSGEVLRVIPMAAYGSDEVWFYRLSASLYHCVIPTTDPVVFHETTNGPFRPEDTVWAPWAPQESDHLAAERYAHALLARAESWAAS